MTGAVRLTEELCWDMVEMVKVVVRVEGMDVNSKTGRERVRSCLIGDVPI